MKILHVFSNFVPSGPEIRTVRLIAALGDEFRHSIVSMDGRTTAAALLPAGMEVRILPHPPKAGSLATAWRLRRLLLAEQPDLVLTYNWGAFDMLLAARSAGFRRVIHHEEGFNEDEAESFKLRRVLARRLVLPSVHCLVVPSQRLRYVATGLWKLNPERVRLIPNGIDPTAFPPADGNPTLRQRLGLPADALVVGTVGGLRPVKNQLRLLDACAAAGPGVHVLLVGDGEERPALEERARREDLAGRVCFAGHQADPAPFLQTMDVFALTSDSEQMPVCLLEAMAACLPVVATDVGDVRAVLPPDQARYLVSAGPEAAAGLARGIADLAADPATREHLGAANRQRIEKSFTFTGMCAAYRAVYLSALRSG